MAHPPLSPHPQQGRRRTSTLPGGWQVLVGLTDADNDSLSFHVARPDDRAAAIAAYHSTACTAGVVAVSGTRVRNVSKP